MQWEIGTYCLLSGEYMTFFSADWKSRIDQKLSLHTSWGMIQVQELEITKIHIGSLLGIFTPVWDIRPGSWSSNIQEYNGFVNNKKKTFSDTLPSRLEIQNWSKTGPTCKLGPDLSTGVGDHKKKYGVPCRHFHPRLRYKAWKLEPQHTGIHA